MPLGSYPPGAQPLPARRVARRRHTRLGDDATILQQVFAGQSGAPAAANVQQVVQQAMSQGALYTAENCSGVIGPSKAALITSAGGSAAVSWATTAIAAGATGPLAPVVLAVGGVLEVFGAIFAHHAAKVKQEQQIICAVVQAINDSLSVIDQAVQQGVITAAQAGPSLDKLYSDLQQNVSPILKQDSSHCNAACFILAEARGVIAKRKATYAAMLPAQASLACAQAYWKLYPDVAADPGMGTAGGPAGAWTHYTTFGKNEGRTWPCDASGNAITAGGAPSITSNPVGAAASLVDQLAASTGLPAIVIWGVGGLAAAKLLGVF